MSRFEDEDIVFEIRNIVGERSMDGKTTYYACCNDPEITACFAVTISNRENISIPELRSLSMKKYIEAQMIASMAKKQKKSDELKVGDKL